MTNKKLIISKYLKKYYIYFSYKDTSQTCLYWSDLNIFFFEFTECDIDNKELIVRLVGSKQRAGYYPIVFKNRYQAEKFKDRFMSICVEFKLTT